MIRLLNIYTLNFKEFHEHGAPPYAIASHRWQDDEATFKDVLKGRNQDSPGFLKIRGFCDLVKSWRFGGFIDQIDWLWIDTCCIDRKSSAELSEAINSMYGWYADAEICVAYLFDVQFRQGVYDLESSEWFERGWTLQELIAPTIVLFTDCQWNVIGHKEGGQHESTSLLPHMGPQINDRISRRTKVPANVLLDPADLDQVSYEVRLSWMNERHTTRVEDQAYCLLGIFDIYMPLIYGERQQATRRLLNEILRRHAAITRSVPKQNDPEGAATSSPVKHTEEPKGRLLRDMNNLQDRIARLEAEQSSYRLLESLKRRNRGSARMFNPLLHQFNQMQAETMVENGEMQKVQAFLESMFKRDAVS